MTRKRFLTLQEKCLYIMCKILFEVSNLPKLYVFSSIVKHRHELIKSHTFFVCYSSYQRYVVPTV